MVSIIIPCYNAEKTIVRALKSILIQSYRDYEIILVDDGSTDNTKKAIEYFLQDKDVKYRYIYQENAGPSKARNVGVKNASGEYVAFLDSDDEWHQDKLKIQMQIIEDKKLNFLGSTYQYNQFTYKVKRDIKVEVYSFNSLLIKTRFSTPGIVMSKEFFISLGGFDNELKYAEDNDLWLRASLVNDLYMITEPKLVRLHKSAFGTSGLSSHMFAMYRGEIQLLTKLWHQNSLSSVKYVIVSLFVSIKFFKRVVQTKFKLKGVQ